MKIIYSSLAGSRHIRIVSLGSVPRFAEKQLFLDDASAAFQLQNEECPCR